MSGGAPTITMSAVTKRYAPGAAEEVRALAGVDLVLPPRSFVSVEGPSGCGKTTLLNLLGLLDAPTSGTIAWDGRSVAGLREVERARLRLRNIGFIFQRFYLVPTMTAAENVALPMRAAGRPASERRARTTELLEQVGLAGKADRFPHELSGGEEQRVAIARALANEPGLLLADEPTGELDRANTEAILELLVRVQAASDRSLLLVTHNPRVAARVRRHLVMEDGRIVQDSGAPEA